MEEFIALTTTIPSTSPKIFFNLTKHNLDQFKPILNLGTKHVDIPPDTSTKELEQDIDQFIHKIGWKEHFQTKNSPADTEFDPFFKLPNKPFTLSTPNRHLTVKAELINAIRTYDKTNPPVKRHPKTSKLLNYLKDHPDIKLILSDKNLGMVAIDTLHYNQLVLQHLESDKYEWICKDTTLFFLPFHSRLRNDFEKTMLAIQSRENNRDLINYVKYYKTYHKWTIPNFHVLAKIHKGFNPLKSRPIVAAVNWFTTPVSRVLAKKIFSLLKNQNHIALNTLDIVAAISTFNLRISTLNQSQYYLVTIDVTELYTNIDLNCLQDLLLKEDVYYSQLMRFVCNNNYMTYDDQVYKQVNGIAMGTNCAPELANFYLLKLLDPILLKHQNVKMYRRYLDDILLLWYGDKTGLEPLLKELQQATKLGFKMKASKKSVDFLDLKIFFNHGSLEHCTHQKRLNKYGYIARKSCHPTHTFTGFIKGELTRYALNSSRLEYYIITKRLFYKRLLNRGYQRSFLTPVFQSHLYSTRLRSKIRATNDASITALSIRYSFRNGLKQLSKRLSVKSNYLCNQFLRKHTTRITWKRSRNLYDMLCSSKLTPQQAIYLRQQNVKPQ